MCILLTILATAFLFLSNPQPTCSVSIAEWKEHSLRYAEDYAPSECSPIEDWQKIDCLPVPNADKERCLQKNCCWSPTQSKVNASLRANIPWCHYPRRYGGYVSDDPVKTTTGFKVTMHRKLRSFFQKDVETIEADFRMETPTRLRVKITDPKQKRWEPPYPEVPVFDGPVPASQEYSVQVQKGSSGFNVVRKESNQSIFTSLDIGDLVYSDQFLEISAILPKGSSIYGLGERQGPLKINNDNDWHLITMFNHDTGPGVNKNLYGTHPFYLAVEPSGHSHGFFLLNSNAMEFVVTPNPTVTIRTIGGILDMYFFLGPTPEDVVRQYSDVVGTPIMPPFWALGYHQCKYGYGSLERTMKIWNQTRQAEIPFETQWNDIDYMENNNDFTYDKKWYRELPAFVKQLHEVGMHYIPILDPGVSAGEQPGTYPPYDEGIKQDIFIKDSKGKPFVGKVWNPESTVWPDFTNPKAVQYWTDMIRGLHKEIPFDGLWIDMNEPANFYSGTKEGCPESPLEKPEYLPHIEGGILSFKTICMTAQHYIGTHYDVHNLYGMAEGMATNIALIKVFNRRPFVLSRSSFAGHGKFASHWSGDVSSTWYDMKMSIPQMLSFNMFQIPMVGADICGFSGNASPALCNRWMQLGAFYPFARNHNTADAIDQDPVSMGELVVKSAKKALRTRYRLHPYLYTLFYLAHTNGTTVARPLFFEFFDDPKTFAIDEQFLWGKWLLINPVLKENDEHVSAYIPKGIWYDFNVESGIKFVSSGGVASLAAPLDTIPLLVRGGAILPLLKHALTTAGQLLKPFELLVAPDSQNRAEGLLFWDDGQSLSSIDDGKYLLIKFEFEGTVLRSTPIVMGDNSFPAVDIFTVLNVAKKPKEVRINNMPVKDVDYQPNTQVLIIKYTIDLAYPFHLDWTFS